MRKLGVFVVMGLLLSGVGCKRENAACQVPEHNRPSGSTGDGSKGLCNRSAYARRVPVVRQGHFSNFGAPRQSIFSPAQRDSLERKLKAFAQDQGVEIVVVEIPALVEQVAWSELFYVQNSWNLGKDCSHGVALFVVATTARKVAWEVLPGSWPSVRHRDVDELVSKMGDHSEDSGDEYATVVIGMLDELMDKTAAVLGEGRFVYRGLE